MYSAIKMPQLISLKHTSVSLNCNWEFCDLTRSRSLVTFKQEAKQFGKIRSNLLLEIYFNNLILREIALTSTNFVVRSDISVLALSLSS